MARFAAVDLGASSGRVCLVTLEGDSLHLDEVSRFTNGPVTGEAGLQWPFDRLMGDIIDGLTLAARSGDLDGIGVDSWAVDYGRLGLHGDLLDAPMCYRDARTTSVIDELRGRGVVDSWFARTGIAHQPFNTVFQLAADRAAGNALNTVALIPDLVNYFLSGEHACEITNASTTGLLGVDGKWSSDIFSAIDVDETIFDHLVEPGNILGPVRDSWPFRAPVINVASHDTASAIVAVPATQENFAYISCGTWSLVGVELEQAVVSEGARLAGFSNERGVEGTFRFLHNVMGLWVLSECQRHWADTGQAVAIDQLLDEARRELLGATIIDINDASLFAPGDMPARVALLCQQSGQRVPQTPAQFTRIILDSLAEAYRAAIERLEEATGRSIDVIHMVGGGARNALLCQLTADATRRRVIAGPTEAAALGNALVQASAVGAISGDRWAWRRLLATDPSIVHFVPTT